MLPGRPPVRVRAVQIHDEPVDARRAGQRVALNLAGIAKRDVARGDVVAPPGALQPALSWTAR